MKTVKINFAVDSAEDREWVLSDLNENMQALRTDEIHAAEFRTTIIDHILELVLSVDSESFENTEDIVGGFVHDLWEFVDGGLHWRQMSTGISNS